MLPRDRKRPISAAIDRTSERHSAAIPTTRSDLGIQSGVSRKVGA
jgi:hypothetical protein